MHKPYDNVLQNTTYTGPPRLNCPLQVSTDTNHHFLLYNNYPNWTASRTHKVIDLPEAPVCFNNPYTVPVHLDTCLPNKMLSRQTGQRVARIFSTTVNLRKNGDLDYSDF